MKISKRTRFLVIGLVIALLIPPLFGIFFVDRFILPPIPASTPGDGSPRFEIPHKGGVIEVFRARSPGAKSSEPKAFVLRFTDNAYNAAGYTAARWGSLPVESWVVSYPGYGSSSGPRSLRALADAALVAYDALSQAAAGRPIILEGFSLGTAPALHVAANRRVGGVVLQNAPPLPELILRHGWWNLWLVAGPASWSIPADLDSVANAKRCRAPLVFLIAEKDGVISADLQERIHAAYAGPKKRILQPGADHIAPLTEDLETELWRGKEWILQGGR